MTVAEKDWTWSERPTSDARYDAMISSVDEHLARCGFPPFQRVCRAEWLIAKTLDIWASLPRPRRTVPADEPFGVTDLLDRVADWYDANYGKRMRAPFLAHSFAIDLRGTLWRVRLPKVFGTITVYAQPDLSQGCGIGGGFNVLAAIDRFPQAYANRLRSVDAQRLLDASQIAFTSITFLSGLRGDMFGKQAGLDFEHSVDALLTGFSWSKASWETAQCAEKVMKAVLIRKGCERVPKGKEGHDIPLLGQMLEREAGVSLDGNDLGTIHCDPGVRYGEQVVSPSTAYGAHEALLRLLKTLSDQLGMSEYA
ncbi:MAG TPA: hypothetical protein VJL61_12070 [Rhodanobacteraceae bacterium]|nr:hypothetical protein [Rhodanobacteraceae bacterium]